MRIDIGSIRADGTADANGTTWWVESMEGWDAPDDSLDLLDPTGRHGQVVGSHWYRGRPVILTGAAYATSEANMWTAHNQLAALIGLTSTTSLVVYETVTKTLDVIRGGKPNIAVKSSTAFRWQLSLLALNPFKRGASGSSVFTAGQTKTIAYGGTTVGFPTITTGGTGAVDVSNATTTTRVETTSVPSGTVVDNYARTVYSGSTNNFAKVKQGVSWLTLLPGNNTVTNNSAASVTLAWYDLYL